MHSSRYRLLVAAKTGNSSNRNRRTVSLMQPKLSAIITLLSLVFVIRTTLIDPYILGLAVLLINRSLLITATCLGTGPLLWDSVVARNAQYGCGTSLSACWCLSVATLVVERMYISSLGVTTSHDSTVVNVLNRNHSRFFNTTGTTPVFSLILQACSSS